MDAASFLLDQHSLVITSALFGCLVVSIEAGLWVGSRLRPRVTKDVQSQINAIRASMLGIIALLVGFTFSQALGRFDARSEAVIDESNAIGTAFLRTDLIPAEIRPAAKAALRDYVDIRVRAARVSLRCPEQDALERKAQEAQSVVWRLTRESTLDRRDPVTASFITAVNEMVDAYGRRDAESTRHVPSIVILVLMFSILLAGIVLGMSCGAEGHRPSIAVYALAVLIVSLVFLILDLDRARHGLIRVSHDSLNDLHASVQPGGYYDIDRLPDLRSITTITPTPR